MPTGSGFGPTRRWDAGAVASPEDQAKLEAVASVAPEAPAPEAPSAVPPPAPEPAKAARGPNKKPKTVTETAPPAAPAAEASAAKPESVTVAVTTRSNDPEPVLSEKTVAEMEEGRKTIARFQGARQA